jgi:tetratricopeptide (TPR) repeat protein
MCTRLVPSDPVLAICLVLYAGASGAEPADAAAGKEPAPTATAPELLSIAEQYKQQIARLESEYGAYDARLGEQLLSQGRVYQQLKDHTRALEALKRAHHIKRVNDGLQNLGQVPILQNITESNIALRDWDAVDQNFDQLLWIYRRNYADGDPELLKIYDQAGRWKIQAYRDGLLKSDAYTPVSEAAYLFSKAITLTEQRVGQRDPRLIDLLYGDALARAQDEKYLDMERRFFAAPKSLERIVSIHNAHPELPPDSRAEALTHLGDWYLMRGSTNTALEHYQQAWQLLQGAPDGRKKLESLFSTPVALPALRLSIPSVDKEIAPENPAEFVTVTFDVSKNGRVHNARITEQSPNAISSARRRALESLRGNRFRPRLENGVAVDTVGSVKRFPIN